MAETIEEAVARLTRFAVDGESGFDVYPGGIFGLDAPNPFYADLRALLSDRDKQQQREAALRGGELIAAVAAQDKLAAEVERLQALVTSSEQQRYRDCDALRAKLSALEGACRPFATVADEYDDKETDDHEVWKDVSEPVVRKSARLGNYRAVRASLDRTVPAEEGIAVGDKLDAYEQVEIEIADWREALAEEEEGKLTPAPTPMPTALPMPEYHYQQEDMSGGSALSALPAEGEGKAVETLVQNSRVRVKVAMWLIGNAETARIVAANAGPRWNAELERAGELLALIAASPQEPQDARREPWQPIVTAPRDGTHIILAFGQDHSSEGWFLDDDGEARPWAFIDIGDNNVVIINRSRDGEYGPSHWQPMPYREPRNRPYNPDAILNSEGAGS